MNEINVAFHNFANDVKERTGTAPDEDAPAIFEDRCRSASALTELNTKGNSTGSSRGVL